MCDCVLTDFVMRVFSVKDFDSLKIDSVDLGVASDSCDQLSDDVFSESLVLAKGSFELNVLLSVLVFRENSGCSLFTRYI